MSGAANESTKVAKSDGEWRRELTAEEYYVTREKGTEPAFTGQYWNNKHQGVYRCVCCGTPLFDSTAKYDSGTGWPSFWEPVDPQNVGTQAHRSMWMSRTEVLCRSCNAHLGHVFDDGPAPRVCVTASTRRPLRSKQNPQTATIPAAKKRTLIERVVAESPRLACCNVGLGRPLIPTAFVANLFRSAAGLQTTAVNIFETARNRWEKPGNLSV